MDLSDLNRLRKEGTSCDITLRVGEKTIRAHKNVISSNSPYFMAMFSGYFSESDQQEISIKEVDADSLELLIDYMYTEILEIDSDNVMRLIVTSSFLQITKAEELCCDFIEGELNADNWIEYLQFGVCNSIKCLVDLSIFTAANDFTIVFSQNEYLEIQQEEFKQLVLKSREIGQPEDLLYSFVMRWINWLDTRIDSLNDLLELLDPSLVSPHVIQESKVELNTSSQIVAAWSARANAASTSNEPGDHILVYQMWGGATPVRIKIFSQANHRQIRALPKGITGGSYVCNGYYIYHQGGNAGDKPLTDSYVYHPIKCKWVPFIPLQEAREFNSSCVLNGRLFSVGGSDGCDPLSSVEFTDLHTGQRGLVDPLPQPNIDTALGIHENSIYAVGGSFQYTPGNFIYRFDGRERGWEILAPPPHTPARCCAVIGESIYITSSFRAPLLRYDIRANDWAMISADRYPSEVFAIDNTLFGLFDDHVARFIHETFKWENQRTFECNITCLQVSTNLLFPNVNEKDIRDPVFEGFAVRESESDIPDDDDEVYFDDDDELESNNSEIL